MRAGAEKVNGGINILGAFLTNPLFFGSKPIGSESCVGHEKSLACSLWDYMYPGAPDGADNPLMNPVGPGAANLAGLGCARLLVTVAEKDGLRDRGVFYYNAVKESGWEGEMELIEVEGEDHAFQIIRFGTENAKNLIKTLASFLLK